MDTPYVWKVPNKSSKTCKIKVIAYDSGYNPISDESDVSFGITMTGVAGEPEDRIQKFEFRMAQNAPNPFNRRTTISYQLPQAGQVSLKIYNINGQLVKTLVDRVQGAGAYRIKWDGKDESGQAVASGVYLYQIKTGKQGDIKKMILLK
ncbi:T9SS type A sorting domain-containing protein [candidate division TA06 bacterium]|uniref:T9SS type A sorting domain-containing protein n=1 Tax=candidate division TA06 bacterium TaxID=2250710 RepID=A0A933ICT9_UNCT6|nr:T9SS type A sorting domain-containing protein [candidate division TA06 bacterium]